MVLLLPLPGVGAEVVVKSGETLAEIADRYGTTVNRLMEMNGLRNANDLWAGSRIKVPGNLYSGGGLSSYTVKPGETLADIANRYGTSVDQLMRLNRLRDANDLWAGSRIRVPGASSQSQVSSNAISHTVQDGETLSEIAYRYGVPMSRLIALNNLSRPDQLIPGSILRLKRISEPQKDKIWVKVRKPLTLGGLAAELGEEIRVIARLNNVKTDHDFEPGDWLILPSSAMSNAKRLPSIDSSELRRTPPLADRDKAQPELAPLVPSMRSAEQTPRPKADQPDSVTPRRTYDQSPEGRARWDQSLDDLVASGVVLPTSRNSLNRSGVRPNDATNVETRTARPEMRPQPSVLPKGQIESAEGINKIAESITVRIEGATQGSGVLVKRDGNRYTVLTAWHVVSGQRPGEELDIYTSDGQRHQLDEGSIKRLGVVDLAIVQYSSPKIYEIARIGDIKDIQGGTIVYMAGFPLPSSTIPTRVMRFVKGDIVANISSEIPEGYQLLYSNPTLPGMSGGAVLNSKGELVGIHASAERDDEVSEAEGKAVATRHNVGVPISYFKNYSSASARQASTVEQGTKGSDVKPANMSDSLKKYFEAVEAQEKLIESLMRQ